MKGLGIFVSIVLAIAAIGAVVVGVITYLKNRGYFGAGFDLYDDEDFWDYNLEDVDSEIDTPASEE